MVDDGHGREDLEEMGKRIKREMDASPNKMMTTTTSNGHHHDQVGRRVQMVGPVLNTVTPCAACKLLRRRCAEECPFSPYFSPHEPQKFAAVHKVFGASNVSKMLLEVAENQRADAANSLVYEANVRLRDPVYGCMGAISALQRQIQTLQAELNVVRAEILKFKYREAAANSILINSTTTAAASTTGTHHMVAGSHGVVAHQQPQPPTTPPLVSVVGCSSPAASALYTPPSSTTGGFSSISSESVAYFD
ncbi:hypothetical protein V2J09_007393 [Rumex salicifolius]